MFKHPAHAQQESKLEQTQALLDFALAEICSGVEMVHAAKMANNETLSAGFIRHAFDEYKHAQVFNQISKAIAKREGLLGLSRYLSLNAYDKRYVDRSAFLFEKMSLGRFSIFVHISERYAANHFSRVIEKANILNKGETIKLNSILVDENRHIAFSYASSKKFKMTNPIKYFLFTIVEKINLLKRNINDKSSFIYDFITKILLSLSLFSFRIIAKLIDKTFLKKNNNRFTLSSAISRSSEMF